MCILCLLAHHSNTNNAFRSPFIPYTYLTVYTAYGDYIVGFNARTGEQVFELRLPFNKTSSNYYGGGGMADIRMMIPQPAVRSLILHEASKRLVVISDGFASQKIAEIVANSDGSSNNKETTFPILFERYDTHIRLYDTDSLVAGNSDPLTTYDINGNFNAVRSIDGIVHIMTTTGIDVNSDLIVPFERSNKEFANMTDDEYIAAVQVKAKTAIPAFTNKLLDEITLPNGNVPNLARISIFSDQSNSGGMEELTMPLGPVNTYAQITTFDVSNSDQGVDATASGTFLSDYWARFYGATNSIIIASQGTKILEVLTRDNGKERRTSIDTTYFTAFSIDGTTTAPHSVGQVDGYLLNEHAIDVKDDALRVAVILWNYTYVWDPSWAMYDDAVMILEGDVVRNLQSDATSSPAVEMDDWLTTQPETVTQNFVVVLQMPGLDNNDKPGAMEEVGRVQIGKPGESITAVRFFDNIAYAVTFEQTDPFYVLDLENGAKVLGEVEISGFSSYLHSINDDNTLILAIGQETDSDGMILGLQLTVFDMSDPASPAVLQRHVVESSSNVDSYSDALWDFKAIRYAGGRLILPMDIYPIYENVTDTESFHGFVTFAVNATGITEECSINHVQEMSTTVCYYCSSLPRRSMIFDGNVVTMQNHGAMSTNMDTCQDQWQLALSVPSGDDCCNAWY